VFTEKYPNAPITEALFDIRIAPALNIDPKAIADLHNKISNDYPEMKARHFLEAKLEFKDNGDHSQEPVNRGIDGYMFWSQDKKQVCQFRKDGFSFSRLKPYISWEDSYPEFKRLWEIYKTNLEPKSITRFALRFINLIEIPESSLKLEDYFVNAPSVAGNFDQPLEGFISRFILRFDPQTKAVITLNNQPTNIPQMTHIVFDIDIFTETQAPIDFTDFDHIFDKLKSLKNTIFENTLTEKTKVLFRNQGTKQ
jgi:uncharacterized protein (TIGR04255 family)